MHLSEAAAITRGELHGLDARFDGVAIDSRNIRAGDLFIAISDRRDGHDFIRAAGDNGAAGAVVSRAVDDAPTQTLPQIKVADTTAALGKLGANWRARFKQPVVAVTGSNGKTTVSALLAAIFNHSHHAGGNCLSPRGSFNNHWGVPLTLLRMREQHTHIVIEMGMNHHGEINYLSELARPDIALINNVAPAHLAAFKNIQDIADAKAEIFNGLADDGVAVLNKDDAFYQYWRDGAAKKFKVLTFGKHKDADVTFSNISEQTSGSQFELVIGETKTPVALNILGKHNIQNAAAAAAVATAAGIAPAQIKTGLESFTAVEGRLQSRAAKNGARLIDDTYNANPSSMKAALDAAMNTATRDGECIAVLGAMAELGANSDAFHLEVGEYARECGVQHLFCLAEQNADAVKNYARGFGDGAKCFNDLNDLVTHITPMLNKNITVLIKGSRAAAMERVAVALAGGDQC